jgi:predicted amidohydrolase
MKYDYWIRGGKVIDPARETEKTEDVLICNGKIMPPSDCAVEADEVVEASGCLVTPGLTDFHTHLAANVTDFGLSPDLFELPNGVTAAVDAGTVGWANFPAHYRYVVAGSSLTIRTFLNISSNGIPEEPYNEITDPARINEAKIRDTFERYSEQLLGLKVRVGKLVSEVFGLKPLAAAVELGKKLGVPVVAHVVHPEEPYREVFKILRPGDILCHCFQGKGPYTLIGKNGKVLDAAKEARARGVLFDHAAGRANYSFGVAQKAIDDGFYPDIISTDAVAGSAYRRKVFSLPYTVSAYLAMGMPLLEAIRRCTQNAARLMKLEGYGTLAPGAAADVAIFKFQEQNILFQDQLGNSVSGKGLLVPLMTIKAGQIVYRNITFMDW